MLDKIQNNAKKIIKNEQANTLVENVIILPLIFIVVIAMLLTCFIIHDRSTLEAAAKRGAIYAAHCIADPNYASILEKSGNTSGDLDISEGVNEFTFTEIGKNIQPYRYLKSKTTGLTGKVQAEVLAIVKETRIPWRTLTVDQITFTQRNMVFYQDVTVSISAQYPLPKFFSVIGLDTNYNYTVTAKMTVNDPDEFIRNVDLVVDMIVEVDNATGGYLQGSIDKISELATKLLDWLDS